MKKIALIIACILCISLFGAFTVSASGTTSVTFDWEDLGVICVGTGADAEDYKGQNGAKVVNARCSFSGWDHQAEYLWLISNFNGGDKGPTSVLLGDNFNMAEIKKITFDYVTDVGNPAENKVLLTADAAGTQVVASYDITKATGQLRNPENVSMTIANANYKGPLYLYATYSIRMFVANLTMEVTAGSSLAPTQAPTQTPTQAPTQVPTQAPTQAPSAGATGDVSSPANSNAPTQAPDDVPEVTNAPEQTPAQKPIERDFTHTKIMAGAIVVICLAAVIAIVLIWRKE